MVKEDLKTLQFESTDYVVSYYTAQFLEPHQRQNLFSRVYKALNTGGALVLFEKIRGSNAHFQDIFTFLYQDYKLGQGYTSKEILLKAKSLRGILKPFCVDGNIEMLKGAGFTSIQPVFQNICFLGILAIK